MHVFEHTIEDGYVVTRDGTRIAYTLHQPVTDDPVPALLEALPYRKDDMLERTLYERLAGSSVSRSVAWTCVEPAARAGALSTSTPPRSSATSQT